VKKRPMRVAFDFLKEMLKPKTLNQIMAYELREAQRKKLEAESAVEYAKSVVQFNEQRIKRLEQRLMDKPVEETPPCK